MQRYKNNPRSITKKAFAKLQETLDEFGDLSGIVHDLNSDQIVGGNQRSSVFDVAKMQPVVTETFDPPTRQGTVATGYVEWHGERFSYRAVRWTEQQCAEANIIANTAGGQWDADLIAGWPVETLQKAGWDADLLKAWNADGAILATMLQAEQAGGDADAEPQIDRAAALNEVWGVKTGDLWRVADHLILCGDSTKREDVERVMQGEKARLCHTDPPYGVDYANVVGSRANQKAGGWRDIENDALNNSELEEFLFRAFSLTDAPVLLCWHSWRRVEVFLSAIRRSGWKENAEIIWVKNALVFGMSDYQWRHETCIYAKRDGAGRQEDRKQTTVWEFPKTTGALHPTQKPTELFMTGIENHTKSGDVVYEPFAGAGGNLIACQNLQRKCRAIEVSPAYVAVCLERMSTAFPTLTIERIT